MDNNLKYMFNLLIDWMFCGKPYSHTQDEETYRELDLDDTRRYCHVSDRILNDIVQDQDPRDLKPYDMYYQLWHMDSLMASLLEARHFDFVTVQT